MKTNSLARKHAVLATLVSSQEETYSWSRLFRLQLCLLAVLFCVVGGAFAQTPAPFVIQGPTIAQNSCSGEACANISYPAGSPITNDQRVVQANTGNLVFDIPVVSNIPSTAAIGLEVGFLVRVTATGGAAGEVQTNSAETVMTGKGSATLQIPIPVEWAESEVRFEITYWVSGSHISCISKLGCKSYSFYYENSTTGPNLSSIALGIPAPVWLDGVEQPAGSFPADAFLVVVTPQAAFQLPLQPVGIIYAPVGNSSNATSSLTFTSITGTNQQFTNSQSGTTGLTQDAQTNYQAGVNFSFSGVGGSTVKLGFNFSGSWDNSVENDQQLSSTASILTAAQQTSKVAITNYPEAGEPPLNEVTYVTEPFWDDLILAVVNPQYAVWSYPSNPVIQPIGNDANAGVVELPIWRLQDCASSSAIQPTSSTAGTWQPGTSYSVGSLIVVENGYLQVATTAGVSGAVAPTWGTTNASTTTDGTVIWTNESAHLIPINATNGVQYDWLTSSQCSNIAQVDQFWVKGSQAATPYASVADQSFSSTVDTAALNSYSTENSFSSTYTQTGSLQATSIVTSVGTNSLGLTADVSNLLQSLGINLSFGTTSSTKWTYTNVNTQSLQNSQSSEGIVEATNSVQDGVNPPIELVVNALLDAYFGGIALQVPSMNISPTSASTKSWAVPVEKSVLRGLPGYSVVMPEHIDHDLVEQAREAAALRHSDQPLPVPAPGVVVELSPSQQ